MGSTMANNNGPVSPRLPSPPPFAEIQISPTPLSPSSTNASTNHAQKSPTQQPQTRRIRPGTKSRFITPGPPLTDLSELDSAFQLQEHLAALISSISTPPGVETTQPLSRAACQKLAHPPEGVEESLWCYELTRRLTRDLNVLIVALLNDNCTAISCPEMRASEWQYLCAVHEQPQSCCAIDYSTHTLDQAATMLTSTKYFPSRLSLHTSSLKHLASIFRRLYRIFAHAWFQHRHVFWEVEGEFGLYLFFKTVSDRYHLIPEDNLTLPPEAEGLNAQGALGDPGSDEEEEYNEFNRGAGGMARHSGEKARPDSDEEGDDDEDYPSDDSESDEEEEGDFDAPQEETSRHKGEEEEEEEVGETTSVNIEAREVTNDDDALPDTEVRPEESTATEEPSEPSKIGDEKDTDKESITDATKESESAVEDEEPGEEKEKIPEPVPETEPGSKADDQGEAS